MNNIPINNSGEHLTKFKRNLEKIDSANREGRDYKFISQGGEITVKEVGVLDKIKRCWNPEQFFTTQKELSSLFVAQALAHYTKKDIARNIQNDIQRIIFDPLIGVKRFDTQTGKALSESIISNYLKSENNLSKTLETLVNKNLAEKAPIDITAPDKFVKTNLSAEDRAAYDFAKKWSNKEAVTLFDAKPYMAYMWSHILRDSPSEKEINMLYENHAQLKEYYKSTHQENAFEEIEILTRREVMISLIENHPDQFLELKKEAENSSYVGHLFNQVLQDIEKKEHTQPSIYGHNFDLYDSRDYKILQNFKTMPGFLGIRARDVLSSLQLPGFYQTLGKHASLFSQLQENPQIFTKPVEQLNEYEIHLVLEAKAAYMKIDLNHGRFFNLQFLAEMAPPSIKLGLENLFKSIDIQGPALDFAMLNRLKAEHDQAPFHPRVAIEGGGPTGLLLAMTQFQVGGDVSLFEKRSTFYDRTQVVRLDPKWMTMLKFYLGSDYNKLFVDNECRGAIREDGFGEIATLFLEEALHHRLTALISVLPHEKGTPPAIERLAAHEMQQVIPPEKQGGKFRIQASYNPQYDPGKMVAGDKAVAGEEQSSQTIREIDTIICAGGKGSPIKEKFLPSSIAVTEQQNYGVCSWMKSTVAGREITEVKPFQGQNPGNLNCFQDFRGMVHLNEDFRNKYQSRLLQEFGESGLLSSTFDPQLVDSVVNFLQGTSNEGTSASFKQFIDKGPEQPYVQTRTFENLGLIYIGMEIPQELKNTFIELNKVLDARISQAPAEDRKGLIEEKKLIVKQFEQQWFQNVADTYGLDKNGLNIQTMDKKFAAMFPVEQNRLESSHFFSNIQNGESKLFIAAAGDANNSPHFMRFSGLTGAREDILGLQKKTFAQSHLQSEQEQKILNKRLVHDWERTAEFVIGRGRAFLKPIEHKEIENNRYLKMKNLLEEASKETLNPNNQFPYRIIPAPPTSGVRDAYTLVSEGRGLAILQPGVKGELTDLRSNRKYDSLEQILLEKGLKPVIAS